MDARAAKFLWEAARVAMAIIPMVLYADRRFSAIEQSLAMAKRDAEDLQHRMERSELDSATRTSVDADGALRSEPIRAAVRNTIRVELNSFRFLKTDDLEHRIQQLLDHNPTLKP